VDAQGRFDRYCQPCRRTWRGVVHEAASPEFRYGESRSFVQGRGGDLNGVHDPLGIREGDAAGPVVRHDYSLGEEKVKIK
jgi:hypothetical protein